jgi:hypothetical protein
MNLFDELPEAEALPASDTGVRNDAGDPTRVVVLSTASDPEVCVNPDSGKVGVFAGWSRTDGQRVQLMNRPEANLDYFEGET